MEAELLFTMARKVAPGLGTTGNEGGEEKPAWAWPGSTQKKQTCLSQFKTASQGPDQAREEASPSRPLGAPVSMPSACDCHHSMLWPGLGGQEVRITQHLLYEVCS